MSARPWPRRGSRATFCLLMLLASVSVHAQGLAIRNYYDITDGLPNSRVVCLLLDHRGFLWIGTWEGVEPLRWQHRVPGTTAPARTG
ncbi:MAG: two-component regulator propeller domain-containing protein [Planctomycetota bacterium]